MHVSLAEVESRMQPEREGDHRSGDVHTNHRCSSLGASCRHVTRAGSEIQQVRPWSYGGCVKEGIDEPAGDAAEEVVIAGRLFLPASRLEGIEGIGVNRGLPHKVKVPPT